ncbi:MULTISPECIES: iron ABC transporter ATP-binding protein FetA [Rahnella]|uniref:ABC transporter related protein n=1 Tax=Rahnella sp. (strain Y9602) TaxID=2703885 RepID=A0A0H3FA17_RAHSY|nr:MULTISPECIES: iron ABC transporter ATP-binding protein FetA [Rahnella]AFE58464.1 putative ABC transporter ATP-binding protein YbbL [Rahnella aquatilis HX2]AYA07117.1 iron ABC transporter ATP-binding protein FetA [Rahnella aquatilis]ADW73818.1 ABC transporter related protein [Rahnella aceris]AZP42310.1 iron ABC transporter ATP-binding protein FetA [Rahnella aquatilis]AZP46650.1 iron ABC transporter ATP-binding protein FetA [Rahnella aquatilis]
MTTPTDLLRLQDVSFTLNHIPLLEPVSLTLNPGEFTLLTGPSGSGKSTLLKIIASLQNPTGGNLYFKGENITQIKPEAYRQRVSYCFQTPSLFGETVYDNLALPYQIRNKKPDDGQLRDWLKQVNLSEDMLTKRTQELSGGEKQRIALLRNLQFMPDILLLDEITSALDEENKININDIIAGLVEKEQIAVLWVSHDLNEIRHAKNVITLTRHSSGSASHESA